MATLTWTKSGSGSWSVGSNWNTGTVPGAGDSVVMPGTNAYTVTLDVDPAALGTITVSDSKAKLLTPTRPEQDDPNIAAAMAQVQGKQPSGGSLNERLAALRQRAG
ncbi:MAG: G8 domain-containing protein [Rhodospirillales bacterium]|nr:G8 domain-containing protein [Rhodospirillales bacterium]